jgi:hypothetical protein
MVTHLDVTRAEIEAAADVVATCATERHSFSEQARDKTN